MKITQLLALCVFLFTSVVYAGNTETFNAPAVNSAHQPFQQLLKKEDGQVMNVVNVWAVPGYTVWHAWSLNKKLVNMSFADVQQEFYQLQPQLSFSKDVGRYFNALPANTWWQIPLDMWHAPVTATEIATLGENNALASIDSNFTDQEIASETHIVNETAVAIKSLQSKIDTLAATSEVQATLIQSLQTTHKQTFEVQTALLQKLVESNQQISLSSPAVDTHDSNTGMIMGLIGLSIVLLLYIFIRGFIIRKKLKELDALFFISNQKLKESVEKLEEASVALSGQLTPEKPTNETTKVNNEDNTFASHGLDTKDLDDDTTNKTTKFTLPDDLKETFGIEFLDLEIVPTPKNQEGVYVLIPGMNDPVSEKNILHHLNKNLKSVGELIQ